MDRYTKRSMGGYGILKSRGMMEFALNKLATYEDLEDRLNGISLQQLAEAFIEHTETESGEKHSKGRILTNKDIEDYDNRYWHRQALTYAAQLGEIRIWLAQLGCTPEKVLEDCKTMFSK